jgi:predicted ATPase
MEPSLDHDWSALCGRDAELACVRSLLAHARLVTLMGPPGAGKSRLACEYVQQAGGGVRIVDLDCTHDHPGVLRALATALDVQLPTEGDGADQVQRALRGRGATLLLLDNVERAAAALAEIVPRLLAGASEARVLATSQQALGIAGEHVYPLPPLQPDAALALFVARARLVRPEFALDDDRRSAVESVVERLDGNPLTIELAAALMDLLEPEALVERLDRSLDLLVSWRRDVPHRHRSLRAAVEHVWQLLSPWEAEAAMALAAFPGTFRLEIGEAVLARAAIREAPDPLVVLRALARKSVLQVPSCPRGRFRVHAGVRRYALDLLHQQQREPQVQADLAAAVLEDAERCGRLARGRDGARGLDLLDGERETLLALAGSTAAPTQALGALLALEPLLCARGPLARLEAAAGPLLDGAPPPEVCPDLWAAALSARARIRRAATRPIEALADLDRASEAATNPAARARIQARRARLLAELGREQSAAAAVDEALRQARASRDLGAESEALLASARLDADRGDPAAAQRSAEQALTAAQTAGDGESEGRVVAALSALAAAAGDLQAAVAWGHRAVRLARDRGDPRREALAELDLATVAIRAGRPDEARRRCQEALVRLRAIGDLRHQARAEAWLRTLDQLPHAELTEAAPLLDEPPAADGPLAQTLLVGPDACWFRPPGGSQVDLRRRRPLARVLQRLFDERRRRPGATVSAGDLVAHGWPGETLVQKSARDRLHVALSTLRQMGLRGILCRSREGYRLDPEIPAVDAAESRVLAPVTTRPPDELAATP